MSSRGKKKANRIDGSKSASVTKVPTKKKMSPKKKWTLMVLSFLLGICLVLGIADLVVSWSVVHTLIHPEKIGWSDSPMSVRLSYDAFELETANGMVYGWVLPAQNPFDEDAEDWIPTEEYSDKTIVFAPNYDSCRDLMDMGGVEYFVEFCKAGYNVVTFDWTGSGYSDGDENAFLLDKTEELKAVVGYAEQTTEASFLAVQSIGFGCYPAAVATAECEAVDALILDSSYRNFSDVVFGNFGFWTAFDLAPVRATSQWLFSVITDIDVDAISMIDPINRMKGKDLFFIQGESDEVFGSAHIKDLVSLATLDKDNEASYWLATGTGHLRARSYDPETYFGKISDFLKQAAGEATEET